AAEPTFAVLNLPHAPDKVVINIEGSLSHYDLKTKKLLLDLAAPAARSNPEPREREYKVEIEYERLPVELNIETTKLIVGEQNEVAVTINNRQPDSLKG